MTSRLVIFVAIGAVLVLGLGVTIGWAATRDSQPGAAWVHGSGMMKDADDMGSMHDGSYRRGSEQMDPDRMHGGGYSRDEMLRDCGEMMDDLGPNGPGPSAGQVPDRGSQPYGGMMGGGGMMGR